jgi:hypothetical protein
MRGFLVFFVVLFLAVSAQAFLPETHKFICEEASSRVFGVEALSQCFAGENPVEWDDFCLDYMPSSEASLGCMNYSRVYHPSVLADNIFGDTSEHVDYSECPIKAQSDRKFLCGNASYAPAVSRALEWFEKAEASKTVCQRIYAYCVGSNYLSDGRLPTNEFIGGFDTECAREIDEGVEKKITEKDKDWEVNAQCSIEYGKKLAGQNLTSKVKQQFRVTNTGIEKIIEELTAYGLNVSATPYLTTSSTTSTTTSTSSTSTTSTTTSTTLTKVVAEKRSGSVKSVLALVLGVIVVGGVYYMKKKEGVKKKPRTLLGSSEHTHPTHLEGA